MNNFLLGHTYHRLIIIYIIYIYTVELGFFPRIAGGQCVVLLQKAVPPVGNIVNDCIYCIIICIHILELCVLV